MLPGLLKQLMPGASLSDLLHIEALLLLLMPPADSAAFHDSVTTAEAKATAGDSTTTCSAGLQHPAPAAAAESMQQLAAALDAAYTAGMQVHAAAAAYYDPSEVVVRLQEYIQDNQQLLQEVGNHDSDYRMHAFGPVCQSHTPLDTQVADIHPACQRPSIS